MFSHFRKTKPNPGQHFVRDIDGDFPITEQYANEGVIAGWLELIDIRTEPITGFWNYYYRHIV